MEQITETPEIRVSLSAANPCRLDTMFSGPWFRTVYRYNQGLVSETIEEEFDGTTEWLPSEKKTYTYDLQGNRTEELVQTWNGNEWQLYNKYSYLFDGQGNQTELLEQYWTGTDWLGTYKEESVYNVHGQETEITYYDWDGSNLVLEYQRIITDGGQGYAIEFVDKVWDGSMFVNDIKGEVAFDSYGNLTAIIYSQWISTTNIWNEFMMLINSHLYDSQNRVIEEIQQRNGDNYSKSVFTYDNFGNILTANYYQWDGTAWAASGYYTYVYDCASSVEETENAFGLNLWPNPVANTLNLKIAKNQPNTISVFDVSGKMVMTQAYTTQIAVDGLTPGMYVLELRNEDSVQHQRFIKQ